MSILKLAELCTDITIKPEFKKTESDRIASVDARVCVRSPDGCFQYAQIHSAASTVKQAIERALRIAEGYANEAKEADHD